MDKLVNEMSSGPTILFVAMHDSIHAARWIELASTSGTSLHMFPLDSVPTNPNLRGVTLHWPISISVQPASSAALAPSRLPLGRRIAQFTKAAWFDSTQASRLLWPKTKNHLPTRAPAPSVSDTPIAGSNGLSPLQRRSILVSAEDLGPAHSVSGGQVRLGESTNECRALFGPWVLASLIRQLKPTLIHSMEFQHAGYLVLKTKEIYGEDFPPWLATNWGSDIFFFRRFADHAAQIQRLLTSIDYYSCECVRDIGLARQLGYRGPALPVLPNSGGFDIDHVRRLRSPIPTSRRKVVMIKGYHHFAGRAMTAIKVLERFADQLRDYEIVLYSVGAEPRAAAIKLAARKVLNFRVIDWATHDEMLANFGRARLYMGISISDAISTSVLESMAMGAFPIQTDTSCCGEWIEDGKSGFIVPHDDFDVICDRFQRALNDDVLVDQAAEINWATVCERLDNRVLRPKVRALYDQILNGSSTAALRPDLQQGAP